MILARLRLSSAARARKLYWTASAQADFEGACMAGMSPRRARHLAICPRPRLLLFRARRQIDMMAPPEKSLVPEAFFNPREFANGFCKTTFASSNPSAQPASPVSVGRAQSARICTTFPRVSETSSSLCGAIFWIPSHKRLISRASLWSPTFNIRDLMPQTRFELA